MNENIEAIRKYNPWEGKMLPAGMNRIYYTEKIEQYIGNRLVKVLVGQRRSGKSFILRQVMNCLMQKGVNGKNILFISKEFIGFNFVEDFIIMKEDKIKKIYPMKIKHLLLALLLLLCSCGENKQQTESCIHLNLTTLIDTDAREIPLNEWAKNTRFIPLETNDAILIKYISMVYQKEDKFLVSHGNNRLSVFDMEGKYLHDISSKGEGPTNFVSINDVTLHNDLIYIHETKNIIKAYDWQGTFIKKMELPEKVDGLITIDGKKEMLAYVPNLTGDESLRFYRMNGEKVIDSIPNPFVYPKAAFAQMFFPEFQPTFGHLKAFLELHSDTLYQVNENWEITPYLSITIGKYQPTREERYHVVLADVRKNPMNGKMPLIVTGEIDNRIYLHSRYTKKDEFFCYDKQNQESSKLLLTYQDNMLDIPESAAFKPRTILNNKFLADWEQPENDENPILVLVEP